MKKYTKICLIGIMIIAALTACKKNDKSQLANAYSAPSNSDIGIYVDIPLSYSNGKTSNIAVIGKDALNSEGSTDIKSESALLIDATTGEVLFQKNPHKKQYPASTTKILTALLAIRDGDTTATHKVGDEVIIKEDNIVMCDFRMGDLVNFDTALHGALLRSGNDAAAVLSLFDANSLDEFAGKMNDEALKLGATNSHFVNPHGLYDDNHYTTAYDMYLIFNEAIKYKKFVDAISVPKFESQLTRKTAYGEYAINCKYQNNNNYVNGTSPTPQGINVIGGKSGYTSVAKRSYVMLSEANGHRYIIVIMRCEDVPEMYHDLDYLLNKIPVQKKEYADND